MTRRLALLLILALVLGGERPTARRQTYCVPASNSPTTYGGWPMAGYDPQRSSYGTAEVTSSTMGVNWYRPIEAYITGTTELITDVDRGYLYIATSRGLIALEGDDGGLAWRFDTELPVFTPTYASGYVYVPGADKKLYKLDADDGALVWAFTADGVFSGNPIVSAGAVFATNRDGKIYKLDDSDGTVDASYDTGEPVMQSAACIDDELYVASMDMYGYKLDATDMSLTWKSPEKLGGEEHSTWWPTIYDDQVIWPGATAYAFQRSPGADDVDPTLDIDSNLFFGATVTTDSFAGNDISSSDGSHGWPSGAAVMDTTNFDTTANPADYTLQGWATSYPQRRVYTLLERDDGAEEVYPPFLEASQNNQGQMHPLITDGTNLYFSGPLKKSSSNIARSAVFAWNASTVWLRRLSSSAGWAIDEPMHFSASGGRFFGNMCCDREAISFFPTTRNYWTYGGTMLRDIIPSQGATDSYDTMWGLVNNSQERLNAYYHGQWDDRNGAYHNHGMQNPLVPLVWNPGSGAIERLFTHRSNAIIALGATASETPLALIEINDSPDHEATTLSTAELEGKLEAHIQEMVDLWIADGDNGFLRPAYYSDGVAGNNYDIPESNIYYRRPLDTIWSLSVAYPHLSSGLQSDVADYLAAYWTKYFVTNLVRIIGFSSTTTNREHMEFPTEVAASMAAQANSTAGVMPQRVFYAAWKYVDNLNLESNASTLFDAIDGLLVYPPDVGITGIDDTTDRTPFTYNDYITGYTGWLALYDLAVADGFTPNATLRANVAAALADLIADRMSNFNRLHPYYGAIDNPTGVEKLSNTNRRYVCHRNFAYLSEELALEYVNGADSAEVLTAIENYEDICPNYFLARNNDTMIESSKNTTYDFPAIMLARAWIRGDSQAELSKVIDVPHHARGDLYYIRVLAATLEAPDTALDMTGVSGPSTVAKYAKYEIDLTITGTVATNVNMPYDASPPTNVPADWGISVDVEYSDDDFETTHTMPCFVFRDYTYDVVSSQDWLYPADDTSWKCRLAFPTTGVWEWRVNAQDGSGTTGSSTHSVTVTTSSNKGYITVSPTDPRYFEYEDGTTFLPYGYTWNNATTELMITPITNAAARLEDMGDNGVSLTRMWMAPYGIWGSSWNPWRGIRGDYGGDYLPDSDITGGGANPFTGEGLLELAWAAGNTHGADACKFIGSNTNPIAIEPSTEYRFRAKVYVFNINGPRNVSFSDYGFVMMMQNPSNGNYHDASNGPCYDAGAGNTNGQVISTYVGNTDPADWVEADWTSSGSMDFLPPFYFALKNVGTSGGTPRVYITEVEMFKLVADVPTGPNLMSKGHMMMAHYFDQRASYQLDQVLALAEAEGVHMQWVLGEQNDELIGQMDDDGTWGTQSASNFYGDPAGSNRWLHEGYWRYVRARWGYSTAIFSFELLNEGATSTRHREQMNALCTLFHQNLAMPRLCSSSTQLGFDAAFWDNASYQQHDYYDIHAYPNSTTQSSEVAVASRIDTDVATYCEASQAQFEECMALDMAMNQIEHAGQLRAGEMAGVTAKPLIRSETGADTTAAQVENTATNTDTRCTWLHSLLWSTLNNGVMADPGYWWALNVTIRQGPDSSTGNGCHDVFDPFRDFIAGIPFSDGHYVSAAPTVTSASTVRAVGQKDVTHDRAHLWFQNRQRAWCGVVEAADAADDNDVTGCPYYWDDSALTGTATVSGFPASTTFDVNWVTFNEDGAATVSATSMSSDGSGNLVFDLGALADTVTDAAVSVSIQEAEETAAGPVRLRIRP